MSIITSILSALDHYIRKYFNKHALYRYVLAENPKKYHRVMKMPVCPICGFVCSYDDDHMEHIMLEEHIACPNKHYSYSFVTGSEETIVGAVTVYGHYTDDEEQREYKSRMINLAIIHEREKWRKQNAESNAGQKG